MLNGGLAASFNACKPSDRVLIYFTLLLFYIFTKALPLLHFMHNVKYFILVNSIFHLGFTRKELSLWHDRKGIYQTIAAIPESISGCSHIGAKAGR
jgi:hypothetical protein